MNIKDVIGYEDRYSITSDGKVYSKKRKLYMKTYCVSSGYECVTLNDGKSYLVHRLVAQHFIPNPENKPCVNHIDFNVKNNDVTNLEWCTYSENKIHSIQNNEKARNQQRHARERAQQCRKKPHKVIYPDGTEMLFDSQRAVADHLGCYFNDVWEVTERGRKRKDGVQIIKL